MFGNMSGPTLLVILFIVLLLFGAPKLPALARSLGQSMKILKKEVTPEDAKSEGGADAPAANNTAASQASGDSESSRVAQSSAEPTEASQSSNEASK